MNGGKVLEPRHLSAVGVARRHPLAEGVSGCGVLGLNLRKRAHVRLRPRIAIRVLEVRRLSGAGCAAGRRQLSHGRRIRICRSGGGIALKWDGHAGQRRDEDTHARRVHFRRHGRRNAHALERAELARRVVAVVLEVLEQVVVAGEQPTAVRLLALEGWENYQRTDIRAGEKRSRFSFVCMERVCRLRCSERVKTLRQSSTGHAYALPLPGLSSVSFVGTGRPLAFFVKFGTAIGLGRRAPLRLALGELLQGRFSVGARL